MLLLLFPKGSDAVPVYYAAPVRFWISLVSGSVYLCGLFLVGFACLVWTCWFVASVFRSLRDLGPLGAIAFVTLATPAAAMDQVWTREASGSLQDLAVRGRGSAAAVSVVN